MNTVGVYFPSCLRMGVRLGPPPGQTPGRWGVASGVVYSDAWRHSAVIDARSACSHGRTKSQNQIWSYLRVPDSPTKARTRFFIQFGFYYFDTLSNPRFWGNPTQKLSVKKIFLEHILRPIQTLVSCLPDHLNISVKKTSQNVFFYPWFLG